MSAVCCHQADLHHAEVNRLVLLILDDDQNGQDPKFKKIVLLAKGLFRLIVTLK
jgi:hypothetical protein